MVREAGFQCMAPTSLSTNVPSFTSVSISFVSLGLVLPMLGALLIPNDSAITLIGPRFRTKQRRIKGGKVIESPGMRRTILSGVVKFTLDLNCSIGSISCSPVANKSNGVRFLLRLC